MGCIASIRVVRNACGGGENLAIGCDRSLSSTIGAYVRFILVEIETYRAGFVLGKYWPSFASVESAATETRSRNIAALMTNRPLAEESSSRDRHRTCVSLFTRFEGSLLLSLASNSMRALIRHLNNTVSRIRKARIQMYPFGLSGNSVMDSSGKLTLEVFELGEFCPSSQNRQEWLPGLDSN